MDDNAPDNAKTPGRRRRSRERGPAKPLGEQLADLTDRKLRDWLRGKEVVMNGPEGPVTVRRDMNAAELRCVVTRLAQIKAGVYPDGAEAFDLVKEAKRRGIGVDRVQLERDAARHLGRPFPPLDVENDDDATRED